MTTPSPAQSLTADVVVVGAGAGGLSTAVTAAHHGLRVVVLERADVCGGATAWSGGWMWAPGNPLAHADGVHEDVEEFRTYLRAVLGADYDSARVDAFLAAAPRDGPVLPRADRADVRARRDDQRRLRRPARRGHRAPLGRPRARRRPHARRRRAGEAPPPAVRDLVPRHGRHGRAGPRRVPLRLARQPPRPAARHPPRRPARLRPGHPAPRAAAGQRDRARRPAPALGPRPRRGRARLVAGHRAAPRFRRPGHRRRRRHPRRARAITAARGVVLAAGGFPHDVARRRALFPRTPTGTEHWSLAPATADGAGTTLGESAGGRLRTDLHSPAAWCPVSLVPYRSGRTGTFPHIMDRAKPGSIGVLSTGRRFVNEANGYHDYVTAMIAAAPEGEPVQSWQIADARFVRRFPLGMAKPLPVPLFPYLRSGYLKKGRTLEELARACGIDPAGLTATVAEFNRNARRGEDPEFGRGSTPFNRYGGDPTVGPNPSLRPLEKGPFYAVRVVPGSFGTFAGLATDARARVLDAADAPVPGLYAVGNDQASVMGGHYPAGGINIGPAMAFGFIAARDLAGVETAPETAGSQA